MQKVLLLTLLILGAFQVDAQHSYRVQKVICDSNIYTTRYGRNTTFLIKGRILNSRSLYTHLNTFKDSAIELKKAKKLQTISAITLGTSIVGCFIPSPASMVFMFFGLPIGFIEGISATKHFKKSLQLYNQEVCNRKNA